MRINPIGANYQLSKPVTRTATVTTNRQTAFQGKHTTAKFLGGIFGTLGTLGAIGGTIIMTGGVALPFVLGYGALSAGSGAILGHMIDKGNSDNNEKK